MSELPEDLRGERMELADYQSEFTKIFWTLDEPGFWKLERQQFFREPGNDSWEAFDKGDWEESLRLLEAGRAEMLDYQRRVAEHGFGTRRVRVVEEPITPYLQWELHALRIRDECGGSVRVVFPEQIAEFERDAPLPEIGTLGSEVLYEAVYDQDSVLESARRTTERDIVVRSQQFIENLYTMGEPLSSYFARNVAPLPPPAPARPSGQ